jgi:hypothetical protein
MLDFDFFGSLALANWATTAAPLAHPQQLSFQTSVS